MSLAPLNVPVIFKQGLDQKTDPKVVQIPSLLELENAVFQKDGRLSKRNGYDPLGMRIEGSNEVIDSGEAIGIFRNELNLYTGSKLYSYIPTTNRWIEKGNTVSLISSATPVLRNPYQQSNINAAAIGNMALYAWEDTRGGVRYSVLDSETSIVQDALIDASGSRPRVITLGNQFLLFYVVGTSLKYSFISPLNPTVITAPLNLTTDLNATPNYDCVENGSKAFVAYYDNSNTITIRTLTIANVVSSATVLAEDADNCISLSVDSLSNLWLAYSDDTNVRVTVYSFTLVVLLAPTTLETQADVVNITGLVQDTTATYFYEVEKADTYNHFIRTNTISFAGVVGTPADFKRSVGLASKAFENNDSIYVNTIHESDEQSTYFTIASTGNIVGKLNATIGGHLINNACLTNVDFTGSAYLFPNQMKGPLESQDAVLFTLAGVNATYLDFSSNNKFQNSELGELHIVGAMVQSYDGKSITEHGFSLFPEDVTGLSYNSGGALTDGSYQYIVTYEWTDNLGQLHRSATSDPVTIVVSTLANKTFASTDVNTGTEQITVTGHGYATGEAFTLTTSGALPTPLALATNYFAIVIDANTIKVATSLVNALAGTAINLTVAGSGTNTIHVLTGVSGATLTIPTLRVTAKTLVTCVVYRTLVNGSEFFRCSSLTSPVFNNISVDTVTFTDTTSDASIQSNDLLYTTGGVLDNDAPPSASVITVYRNRIFLLAEDGSLWYSKVKQEGFPVEFTAFFTKTLSNTQGRVQGLGVIDSNFILFRAVQIETFSGQGPNDTGVGIDYGDPQLVTSDTGCEDPNSIGTTPNGLIFDSPKGRYLLDRSLQASYLGAPVEDYNDLLVTAATLLSDKNEVRFVTQQNILTYNYYFNQWSVFTGVYGEDCAIWNHQFVFVQSTGQVWVESQGFQDGDQPISMKITTSWMSLRPTASGVSGIGINGFQRIWDCVILGEYKSPHKLKYFIGYDFNPNYAQVGTIDPDVVSPNQAYGVSTPYGADETYGGEYSLYQFGNHLTRQKCSSIRFSMYDDQNYLQDYGEGFSITGITLVCGVKQGVNKMPSKQTFSTEAA